MKKNITGNADLIRRINTRLITDEIIASEQISRSQLARKLGLAMPTVMRIVDMLIEQGLVVEAGTGDSSGGRRPVMLRFNGNCMYFVGVCVQRKLKMILTDAVGKILRRYETLGNYDDINVSIPNQIINGIEDIIQASGIPREKVAGVGVGTPGWLFRHSPLVMKYPFAHWSGFDLDAWKKDLCLDYPINFENIPKLGALAELRFGYGRKSQHFVYIFADFGIGSGIVIDGKLYMGSTGVSGELGHTIIEKDGRPCYCGSRGCLEMYSASPAIVDHLRGQMRREETLLNALCAPEDLDFSHVLEALHQDDHVAHEAMAAAGRVLGIGLSNIINLFNPELIVIGGELSDCAVYMNAAIQSARQNVFLHRAEDVRIVSSELGADDLLMGAVSLAMNQAFETI